MKNRRNTAMPHASLHPYSPLPLQVGTGRRKPCIGHDGNFRLGVPQRGRLMKKSEEDLGLLMREANKAWSGAILTRSGIVLTEASRCRLGRVQRLCR